MCAAVGDTWILHVMGAFMTVPPQRGTPTAAKLGRWRERTPQLISTWWINRTISQC
jgi:hypothetical protein